MRVVLDTNILISAFVFPGGKPEAVYRAGLEQRVTLVTSPPLLAEFGRVLSEKFGWDTARTAEAVAQLVRVGDVVRPGKAVGVIEDDPEDNRVLEAADAGHADVIVSGDRHLLQIAEWQSVRIETAAAFLDELQAP